MTEKSNWSLIITSGDRSVEYRWCERFYEGRALGPLGDFVKPGTDEAFTAFDGTFTEAMVSGAAAAFRRLQLRPEFAPGAFEPLNLDEAILELFRRSQEGEYLGQRSNNELLFVQDVAAILDYPFELVRDKVDELVTAGKLGLNGLILIGAEEYREEKEALRRETGHEDYFASSLGYWKCKACGVEGAFQDDPREIPCVPETSSPKL